MRSIVSIERIIKIIYNIRIRDEIRRWYWIWIGYILGGERFYECMVVLRWRLEGRRFGEGVESRGRGKVGFKG